MKKGLTLHTWPLVWLCILLVSMASCSKEERKVDINDGTENPVNRKLEVEVVHRYSMTEDSLLPNVTISLYESFDDEQTDRYYRRDTTNQNGVIIFNNIAAGEFRVVMQHPTHGTKNYQINIPTMAVACFERYYF